MMGNHPAFQGTLGVGAKTVGLVYLVCLVYFVGLVCLVRRPD